MQTGVERLFPRCLWFLGCRAERRLACSVAACGGHLTGISNLHLHTLPCGVGAIFFYNSVCRTSLCFLVSFPPRLHPSFPCVLPSAIILYFLWGFTLLPSLCFFTPLSKVSSTFFSFTGVFLSAPMAPRTHSCSPKSPLPLACLISSELLCSVCLGLLLHAGGLRETSANPGGLANGEARPPCTGEAFVDGPGCLA